MDIWYKYSNLNKNNLNNFFDTISELEENEKINEIEFHYITRCLINYYINHTNYTYLNLLFNKIVGFIKKTNKDDNIFDKKIFSNFLESNKKFLLNKQSIIIEDNIKIWYLYLNNLLVLESIDKKEDMDNENILIFINFLKNEFDESDKEGNGYFGHLLYLKNNIKNQTNKSEIYDSGLAIINILQRTRNVTKIKLNYIEEIISKLKNDRLTKNSILDIINNIEDPITIKINEIQGMSNLNTTIKEKNIDNII